MNSPRHGFLSRMLASPGVLAGWCMLASFGSYACMYGFRKPFTAATYAGTEWGDALKVWYVTAQVLGYTVSKFIGIKVVSEMPPGRRAKTLLVLIGAAQIALLAFALTPAPWGLVWLFFNGLPLGMVFGLVLGFLEGRRMTELFIAGLCASFIFAGGITKSVGAALLKAGVNDHWMPFAAGLVFLLPLIVFVSMLARIPPPDAADVVARSERSPMTGPERLAMFRRHGISLACILLAYLLITVVRSVRDDFAPEIWSDLGFGGEPSVYARSEMWVGLAVMAVNALVFLIKDNRRGFFCGLWIGIGGLALAVAAIPAWQAGWLRPFPFMVTLGVGMYLPYVAIHTVIFERLIALTREKGNIGYLMYLADSAGYLGFVGLMLGKGYLHTGAGFLPFFIGLASAILLGALLCFGVALLVYRRRFPRKGPSGLQ